MFMRPNEREKEDKLPDMNQLQQTNEKFVFNPFERYSLSEQREKLPIFKYKDSILFIMKKHRIMIIVGETGSGKTTQIPQYLYEAGWCGKGKLIGCTQPRRISCISVAKRVSKEKGQRDVGQLVGYDIQFDHCVSEETKIKYLTDGMLIREMMLDPLLQKYGIIMVDEAHERSLYTDVCIGLLKKIMKKRDDLKLIISSATLEAEKFQKFFSENTNNSSYILSVEGRQFPVDVFYLARPCKDYVLDVVRHVVRIHKTKPGGDILAFVTGQDEVTEIVKRLHGECRKNDFGNSLEILPLFSGLGIKDQMKVFEESVGAGGFRRKCVISTNIAEASVTIPGVVYVIDPGFVKQRVFKPGENKDSLVVTEVSQASAKQRCGRAGRVRKGKCFRLYTEEGFHKLPVHTIPEIQRSNLVGVVLQLKALGISDVLHFDFLSPPPARNMAKALEILFLIGALDGSCQLTKPLGFTLAEFPVEPKLAKVLVEAGLGKYVCTEEMITIVAFLSVQRIFSLERRFALRVEKIKRKFAVVEGDHIAFLNIYAAFLKQHPTQRKMKWCKDNLVEYKSMKRVLNVRKQLKRYLKRFGIPLRSGFSGGEPKEGEIEKIQKIICAGFFENVAYRARSGEAVYKPANGEGEYYIHPSSILFKYPPKWVLYHELLQTSKTYMRYVMKIEPDWMVEIVPQYFQIKRGGGKLDRTDTFKKMF